MPPAQISYVQLCDGPAEPPEGGYAREAATGRLLPGDGDLPVRALIDAVGPDVMLGVEAPSRRCAELGIPAAAYAVQAMEAVRRLLDGPGGRAVAGS